MCNFYLQGKCRNVIDCNYAHSEEELRDVPCLLFALAWTISSTINGKPGTTLEPRVPYNADPLQRNILEEFAWASQDHLWANQTIAEHPRPKSVNLRCARRCEITRLLVRTWASHSASLGNRLSIIFRTWWKVPKQHMKIVYNTLTSRIASRNHSSNLRYRCHRCSNISVTLRCRMGVCRCQCLPSVRCPWCRCQGWRAFNSSSSSD
jgi:hypothetical protein